MTTEKTTGIWEKICEDFLDEAMELSDLPGLAVGVTWKGEEYTGVRGMRDVLTKDPLKSSDVFHCASVSKLFTSMAIMKLVAEGKLDLEDRLVDILPEFAATTDRRWNDVRLYQMLSHTAGIGDVTDYHWEEALTSERALSDYVHSEEVMKRPLLWAPGEGGFRYSNDAYEILGHIVSVKSGLSYEEYVRQNLMAPAGMADSTMLTFRRLGVEAGGKCPLLTDTIREQNAEPKEAAVPWHPMALPHEKAEDRSIVPVRYYPYTRSHGPSSTLTSTLADLLKWCRTHMEGFAAAEAAGQLADRDGQGACNAAEAADGQPTDRIGQGACDAAEATEGPRTGTAVLPYPDDYRQISHEYATVPNNGEKMGLGWFMRQQGGCRLYGHEGTDDGFRASLWICPEKELGIVVLSNLSGAPVKKLNKKLFDRLTQEA